MEKINRHNYEAYFLDYLEGNLSAEEKHDLLIFLENNPELKQELDIDLNELKLVPQQVYFKDKEEIKSSVIGVLTTANVETRMIESVENLLDQTKQVELDEFVKKHQLEKEMLAFKSTILKPDFSIQYKDKKKLKVPVGFVIPLYVRVASAAAVVLFIGLAYGRFLSNSNETIQPNASIIQTENNISIASHFEAIYPVTPDSENTHDVNVESEKNLASDVKKYYKKQIEANLEKDSTKSISPAIDFSNDIQLADKKNEKNPEVILPPDQIIIEDEIASNNSSENIIKVEQPYSIVTNTASDITNRDIHFTRSKNTQTNEYVAYEFQLGNFSFERKKSR